MVFKTWLSDINKVALAMDGLQNITQFKTGSTIANGMELSTVAVNKYKASIEGLTLSQAKTALSTTALNEAQQNQILISAGLITSTESVTAADVKQAVAENVLTTAKQQEVLATFEAEMAEGKMSLERLQAIALEDTEAGAIARVILAKKEENVQNLKNIASGKALATVLKEQLLALATNPVTWCVTATAGILALNHAINKNIDSLKEQKKLLEDSETNISDNESKSSELQGKIDSNNQQIEELKGSDTAVDQSTINTLESENSLYEQQIQILQQLNIQEKENAEQAAKDIINNTALITRLSQILNDIKNFDFVKAIKDSNTSVGALLNSIDKWKSGDIWGGIKNLGKGAINTFTFGGNLVNMLKPHKESEKGIIGDTKEQIKNVSDLSKQLEELEANRGNYSADEYAKKHKKITDSLQEESKALTDNIKDLQNYQSKLSPDSDEYKEAQKTIDEYTKSLAETQDYNTFDKVINSSTYGSSKDKLIKLAKQGKLTEEEMDKNYHNVWVLFQALGLSIDDIIEKLKAMGNESASSADKASKQASQSTSSFSSIWNDKEYKTTKNKLSKLAKAGELTPELIKSTKEYKAMWKATNLELDTFIEKIRRTLTLQDKLTMFSKDTKKVGVAYKDYKKNGFVSSSSLNNMPQSFKNLEGYTDFNKTVRSKKTSSKAKQQAFNSIVSEYLEVNEYLDDLTTETSEKIKKKVTTALLDAGVTNAKALVDYYTTESKLITKSEKELEAKNQRELSDYIKMLNEKGVKTAEVNSEIGKSNSQLLNILSDVYREDLKNWVEALREKKRTYNEFVNSYKTAIDTENPHGVYQQTKKGSKGASAFSKFTDVKNKQQQYEEAKKAEKKSKNRVDADYKKIKGDFKIDYHPTTSTGDGTPKNKKDKTKSTEIIDYIERKLSVLQSAIDFTKSKFENLYNLKSKQNNLDKQINQTTTLLNAQAKAAEKYQKKADSIKISKNKKEDADLKKKVRNGQVTGSIDELIVTYGKKTANKISKYQDYIDKAKEAKKATEGNLSSIIELNNQKLDNITEWYEKFLSEIESVQSKIQATIDLTSKIRGFRGESENGSKSDYNNLLGSQADQISNVKTTHKLFKDQYQDTIASNVTAMKKAGKSKKEINAYKAQAKAEMNAALNGYDEQVSQIYSDMLDTAEAMANIPLNKAEIAVSKLSDSFNVLENKIGRVSDEFDKTGDNLRYLISLYEEENKNKAQQLQENRNALSTAQSNLNNYQSKLLERGIDPNSIQSEDDLEKLDDKTKQIAIKYLASLKSVDNASKTLAESTEDYYNTVHDNAKKIGQAISDWFDSIQEDLDHRRSVNDNLLKSATSQAEALSLIDENLKINTDETLANLYNERDTYTNMAINNMNAFGAGLNSFYGLVDDKVLNDIWTLFNQIAGYDASTNTYSMDAISPEDVDTFVAKLIENGLGILVPLFLNMNEGRKNLPSINKEIETAESDQANIKAQAAQDRMDIISEWADRGIDVISRTIDQTDKALTLAETQGHLISSKFYDDMANEYERQKQAKQSKADALEKEFQRQIDEGNLVIGSPTYYDMLDQIHEAKDEVRDTTQSIAEMKKASREATLSLAEFSRNAVTAINDEADFYQGILEREDTISDNGALTDNGLASMALSFEKMTNDMVLNDEIEREKKRLTELYNNGQNPDYGLDAYTTDMNNLLSQQREAINNYYDERDAIKSLIQDGYDKQLEYLQELINKYQEVFNKAKDLRDYQNNIADQTKTITSIEKQIAALEGNTTEEARTKLQSLTVDLQDARKSLEDTEYDKRMSDIENILSDLMEDAQDVVEEKMDQIDAVLEDIRDILPQDSSIVHEKLGDISSQWGIDLSDALDKSTLHGDYSTIMTGMDSIAEKIAESVYNNAQTVANAIYENADVGGNYKKISAFMQQYGTTENVKQESGASREKFNEVTMKHFGVKLSDDNMRQLMKQLGYDTDRMSNEFLRYMLIDELGGFATGGIIGSLKQKIADNGDDVLISAKVGESILTPYQTDLFKEFTKNLPLLTDVSKMASIMPKIQPVSQPNVNVSIGDMNFELPNVNNTEDFIQEWKKNPKLRNFMGDVVYGTMSGDNSKAMRY